MKTAKKVFAAALVLGLVAPGLAQAKDPGMAEGEAEPRTAFWAKEPGRPYEETDAYAMVLPNLPLRLDGRFWVDTGYMQQVNTEAGTFDKDAAYAQGRFVFGASYRHDLGKYFAEARLGLVGFDNEFTNSQYEPHTQDAFVRFGHRLWDVQVGRFLAWEPYYRGNGIEQFTAEEAGARSGPAMYRLEYGLGWKNETGQAAIHVYPASWAAFELATVYGQENQQNHVAVRPTLALRRFGVLLVAGYERYTRRPQDIQNKNEETVDGFAGRVQYTRFGTTIGVAASSGAVDTLEIDGITENGVDRQTVGTFLESDFWNNVVGAGYHLTTEDNSLGEQRHHQAFVSYLYRLPVKGLSVKAVAGFARAERENVTLTQRATFENDMKSLRVRVAYEFR